MSWVVRLVVILPALAGLVGLLVRRTPSAARAVAVGSAAATTVLALAQWVAPLRTADVDTLGGLPLGDVSVPLHLLSDRLSGVVSFVVALVVLAIQVFTVWYLHDDRRYPQFAATVSLFSAGMLLVVQSADLALTLVGWEVMGWCSWLLIGHDSERPAARRAAYKAFLVTRVADIGMVVGLVALAARARSTDLLEVLTVPGGGAALTIGLVGVVVGVAGKSGLVPFHDWLPDAMEGPTPASALIHAATMVAAGSYVVVRLYALYSVDDLARLVLAVLASVTMVWAAALAFAQTDVKRLLAYSTLSQVAVMLAAVAAAPALDSPVAGVSHLVGHAFFKALLFLAAGWVAALVGATALSSARGVLRGRGALRVAVGVGLAALAGVPPLVGFFTKDSVLDTALAGARSGVTGGWVVVAALYLTVALTAAYCTRAWLVLDATAAAAPLADGAHDAAVAAPPGPTVPGGAAAGVDVPEPHAGHHAPITFPAALAVSALAVLSVVGTLFLTGLAGAVHVGVATALVSVLLVAGAAFAVWGMSSRGTRDAAGLLPAGPRARAARGFGVDTAYAAVGRAVVALARVVVALDRDVVDAYPRGAAVATRALGRGGERAHRGVPTVALTGVLVGVVAVAILGVTAWR